MQLEIGKRYKTRDGKVRTVIAECVDGRFLTDKGPARYGSGGKMSGYVSHISDLVEECPADYKTPEQERRITDQEAMKKLIERRTPKTEPSDVG